MTLPESYRNHLLSRLNADLTFLKDEGIISPTDFISIKATLDHSGASSGTEGIRGGMESMHVGTQGKKCRALWDYPQGPAQPDDLQFSKGDTISIEEETNADWWRGSCNGRSGIFPTGYVEVLETGPSHATPPPPPVRSQPSFASHDSHNGYQPPPPSQASPWAGATFNQYPQQQPSYQPPPPQPYQPSYGHNPNGSYNEKQSFTPPPPQPYQAPPQDLQPPAQNVPPPIPKKKLGLGGGGLGKTMATSFAGGLGFGAGAAVAGDAINAIF